MKRKDHDNQRSAGKRDLSRHERFVRLGVSLCLLYVDFSATIVLLVGVGVTEG